MIDDWSTAALISRITSGYSCARSYLFQRILGPGLVTYGNPPALTLARTVFKLLHQRLPGHLLSVDYHVGPPAYVLLKASDLGTMAEPCDLILIHHLNIIVGKGELTVLTHLNPAHTSCI